MGFVPLPGTPEAAKPAHESYSLATFEDEFQEHPDILMTRAADPEFLGMFGQGEPGLV